MRKLRNIITRLKWLLTGDCGHICEFAPQYGCFVPECGCPVHDPED